MEFAILFADATTIVAWWGAIVATIVILWDIFKWYTTGPRILMTVTPNMKIVGNPELEEDTHIIIYASNVGERPTTLENLWFVWYPNLWKCFRRKPEQNLFVKNPGRHRSFPYKLEVGERWEGMATQSDEIVELANTGYLVCHLHHACSKRPIKKRLFIPREKTGGI
jgi:hypothetical protein